MTRPPIRQQRGLALTLVLWVMAALSLAMLAVLPSMRLESRQSHAELQRSKALLAAEGGVSLVVFELLRHPERFPANGQVLQVRQGDVDLALAVRSEHGKLDLNTARLEYFSSLFVAMGASPGEADALVGQMQAHRQKNKPLFHLEELLAVTSMETALFQRVLPHVTLWAGNRVPVAPFIDPTLAQITGLPSTPMTTVNPGSIVSIDVDARLDDGFSAGLTATVMLTPDDQQSGVFRTLHWAER
ncbi:type II secretion system protein GspK [Pseudomonas huaxiensis]|uniref:type II secretion system protein GspK n=1 Tax=Pseudomonas huaxiensis TaxID=2213017 RepID=UPI0013001AFC|nr:type II secretion system protein GspK [Pseudomonas huaxiensis]